MDNYVRGRGHRGTDSRGQGLPSGLPPRAINSWPKAEDSLAGLKSPDKAECVPSRYRSLAPNSTLWTRALVVHNQGVSCCCFCCHHLTSSYLYLCRIEDAYFSYKSQGNSMNNCLARVQGSPFFPRCEPKLYMRWSWYLATSTHAVLPPPPPHFLSSCLPLIKHSNF